MNVESMRVVMARARHRERGSKQEAITLIQQISEVKIIRLPIYLSNFKRKHRSFSELSFPFSVHSMTLFLIHSNISNNVI